MTKNTLSLESLRHSIFSKEENSTPGKSDQDFFAPDHKFDSSTGESSLLVKNLHVYINDNHILKNINLTIPNRKITCIIGPSGCGKSTLLKTLNRLIDTNDGVKVTGKVLVDGENIWDKKVEETHIRRKMGLLSQRPCVLPMSIFDNVTYGCKINGIRGKKRLAAIVEHYLQAAGLWEEVKDRLNSSAARLSIGQQQRLCLARGLAVEPQYILADEATSALDPVSSKTIEELFLQLKEKYSIVLVTHTLRQALRIADYVVFMYMGEIVEEGTAEQVFKNPQQELTRNYLSGVFS